MWQQRWAIACINTYETVACDCVFQLAEAAVALCCTEATQCFHFKFCWCDELWQEHLICTVSHSLICRTFFFLNLVSHDFDEGNRGSPWSCQRGSFSDVWLVWSWRMMLPCDAEDYWHAIYFILFVAANCFCSACRKVTDNERMQRLWLTLINCGQNWGWFYPQNNLTKVKSETIAFSDLNRSHIKRAK